MSLFVFVRPLRFTQSCTAVTWFAIDMLLIAQDPTVGSRVRAAVLPIGPSFWAIALAGGLVRRPKTQAGPCAAEVLLRSTLGCASVPSLLTCGQTCVLCVQLTLSRQAANQTLLQCIFGAIVYVFLTLVRASADPISAGTGILFFLYFGISFLFGQEVWPAWLLWKTVSESSFARNLVRKQCM